MTMEERDPETGFLVNRMPFLSVPAPLPKLRVISHGAGVQTSTLCLMAARGDVGPMPDVAIMADTGGEPFRVYQYLDWLRTQVPFPIIMVRRPGPTLAELAIDVAEGRRPRSGASLPPWFVETPNGPAMLPKQCSGEFKRDVVIREVRRMLDAAGIPIRPATVEMWIGMTVDELTRVTTARRKYIHNRHPLVELKLTRNDCIRWLQDRQLPVPPKSSCVYCPFRRNHQWRHMRDTAPDDFAEAVRIDKAIRPGIPGTPGQAFVHRTMRPLDEADLGDDNLDQRSFGFAHDCDSCGI